MSENSSRDAQRWKTKYLDSISAHEKQTAQADDLLDSVRRALVRVSLIADNQDITLDKRLSDLRKFLRSQSSLVGISPWVDRVEKEYKYYERKQQTQIDKLTQVMAKCLDHWSGMDISSQLVAKNKKISDEYALLLTRSSSQTQLFNQMIDLSSGMVNEIKTQLISPNYQNKSTDQYKSISAESKSSYLGDDLNLSGLKKEPTQSFFASIFNHKNKASKHEEPVYSAVSIEIRGILQRLISQIKVVEVHEKKYQVIDEKLDAGLNWYELVPTLDDVAEFVLLALGNTQDEFEHFLKELNNALTGVYQQLSKTANQQASQRVQAQLYDEQLKLTVASIQGAARDAQNIDELKQTINTQVISLFDLISERRANECLNEQTLEDEMAIMEAKIVEMERESEIIKADIAKQHKLASTDYLTQLPNRQAYQEWLVKVLPCILHQNEAVTFVIADIDHFKNINDRYGHLAGDKVLKILAETLKANLRKSDFICRFGGEKFIILMPETQSQEALLITEKLRLKVSKCPFHFDSEPVSICMSFGLTQLIVGESESSAFSRADKGLYQAKEKGRNCSVLMERE